MVLIIMKSLEKNKINYFLYLCVLVAILISSSCRDVNSNQMKKYNNMSYVDDKDINNKTFIDKGDLFILRFSAILDDRKKPNVLIPIYGGNKGIVKYSQLAKKRQREVSILGGIVIESIPGKVKETIIDCVNFYKKTLLRNIDIEKPTVIGLEGYGMFIWYDFDYMGMPGTIMIGCGADPDCEKKQSKCMYIFIKDIEVNEKATMFHLSINIGSKSYWREKREKEGKWPPKE